ncbi:hypothetical protein R1flu_026081 [Riccia fluitans]|uniref:Uncharacterized protein n=1 Tax=Riccia fluitans TaxID=41844 RepID=A0ABD1XEZ0_9MARC
MEAEEGVTKAKGGVPEPEAGNMEGEEGIMEVEGGITEAEAGNIEAKEGIAKAEGGVTEAKAGNMEAKEGITEVEGGIMEAESKNMEAEEGVTEADEGVMEADLEEAIELKEGALQNLILKRLRTMKEGLRKAKEVAQEMECVAGHNIVHQLQSITLSDTLAVGDVFVVKADDKEMEYWLLQCIARKHKITKKEVRCP